VEYKDGTVLARPAPRWHAPCSNSPRFAAELRAAIAWGTLTTHTYTTLEYLLGILKDE
jgi:hypothetical protein